MHRSPSVRAGHVRLDLGPAFAGWLAVALAASGQEAAPPLRAVSLTVRECHARVLQGNLNIRARRYGWQAAANLRSAEKGVFEPSLIGSAERQSNSRENTVEQRLSQNTDFFEEQNDVYNVAVEQVVPTGGRLRLGASMKDITNNLKTNATDELRGEFEAFAGASVTQPLLRDAGTGATLARLRLAAVQEETAFQEYRKEMMDVLARAEATYWDLYLAQERCRMRGESVKIAGKILEDNRARVANGKMAEIEVYQAEAGLAMRRTRESEARQQLTEASSALRTYFSEATPENEPLLSATDQPAVRRRDLNRAVFLDQAMSLHPDYLIRRRQVEEENIRLAFARNQRWPQLDVKGSYGLNGLGDDASGAWDDISDSSYDAWTVGIELRVPLIGGIRERNELRAAQWRKKQALLALKAVEVEIGNTLDAVTRKVLGSEQRVANHRIVADFNEKLLKTEMQWLEAGKSDSRKVLEVEDDLSEARIAALESLVAYEKALVELDLVSGALLRSRDVEVASAAPEAR